MGIDIKETGELAKKSAFSLIFEALRDQFDGVFVFASNGEKYSIILQKGLLKTPQALVDQAQLGKFLFDGGVLNNESFTQVQRIQEQHKVPFYQAAIQSGLVPLSQVQEFVNVRMKSVFETVFSWSKGKYVVVTQVPKDIVPIEVNEPLLQFLFDIRIAHHEKIGTLAPNATLILNEQNSISMDVLALSPAQLKMVQTLKKTKNVKDLDQFASVSKGQANSFVRAMLDFEFFQIEKSKKEQISKDNYFGKFDFKYVCENHTTLNFYELLTLPPSVTVKDVAGQYFEIAKHYHPDRFRDNTDYPKEKIEKVFARITEAYQTLSKSTSRKLYDEKINKVQSGPEPDVKRILESEGLFLDGMDELRRGAFDKAIHSFSQAIAMYDKEYEYFIRLGWAQYRLGLKDEDMKLIEKGKKALQDAVKKDRILDDVHYYQGMVYKNERQYEKAKASFGQSLQHNKNHMQARQEYNAVAMLINKKASPKKGWFG